MQHKSFASFFKITQELLDIVSSLNADQINRKPFPGSWTIGSCVDKFGIDWMFNCSTKK